MERLVHTTSPSPTISFLRPVTPSPSPTISFLRCHSISDLLHRTLPVPPFHFFDVTDEVVGGTGRCGEVASKMSHHLQNEMRSGLGRMITEFSRVFYYPVIILPNEK